MVSRGLGMCFVLFAIIGCGSAESGSGDTTASGGSTALAEAGASGAEPDACADTVWV
ncbi:MAG TPA: hypothetical protein VIK01_16040 [Polyangiaceae bacterium]